MYQDFLVEHKITDFEAQVLKATEAFENDDAIKKLEHNLGYKPINLLKVIRSQGITSNGSSKNLNLNSDIKCDSQQSLSKKYLNSQKQNQTFVHHSQDDNQKLNENSLINNVEKIETRLNSELDTKINFIPQDTNKNNISNLKIDIV